MEIASVIDVRRCLEDLNEPEIFAVLASSTLRANIFGLNAAWVYKIGGGGNQKINHLTLGFS
jgi:hypothetical protein